MVKAGKRSNAAPAAFPVMVVPSKIDHQLKSLMDYGDNLEEFLAICAHLPAELKDDLNKVATLGEETHRLTAELSRDQAEILEKAKLKYRQMAKPEQLKNLIDEEALQRAREKRQKVEEGVTEKVSITKRMYGALDTCIKNIDEEIAMLEKDVQESYGVVPDIHTLLSAEAKKTDDVASLAAEGLAAGPQTRAGLAAYPGVAASEGAIGVGLGAGGAARKGDLGGTSEPVYCVCRQVGWGDMIGCDNEDCEHGEWFHYKCVGLEQVDEEQQQFWLCPGCSADKREREKKEQLEMKAVPKTTPVKRNLAADVVKLPNSEDDDDDDDDDDEDGGANGGTKVGVVGNPKGAGVSGSKVEATSAGKGKGDKSRETPHEKYAATVQAVDGMSGPARALGIEPKAEGNKPSDRDSRWFSSTTAVEGRGGAAQGERGGQDEGVVLGGASAASGGLKT
eukprot:g6836.t1